MAAIDIHIHEALAADLAHATLDLAGLIPGYGEPADIANAVWYAVDGEYLLAAFSLISFIPVVGDAIGKGSKWTMWLAKKFPKGMSRVTKLGKAAATSVRNTQKAIIASEGIIEKLFKKAEGNEKLAPHVSNMRKALQAFTRGEIQDEEVEEACELSGFVLSESRLRRIISEEVLLSEVRYPDQLVTVGKGKVKFGSEAHIRHLNKTLESLKAARECQRRGSSGRTDITRAISRIKTELHKAQRIRSKQTGE